MRMVNGCNNLNYRTDQIVKSLGEEVTTEMTVGTFSTLILPASINRRIVKIYTVAFSDKLTQFWLKYGTNATLTNTSHPMPVYHLLTEETQATKAFSGICDIGTALLRVSTVEKT